MSSKAKLPKKPKGNWHKIAPQTDELLVSGTVVLTDEQEDVVNRLAKIEKTVQSLGGLAGTGKTTLVSVLLKRLNGFACCAFTGKAADVLRSKGIPDASTIHSLIYTKNEKNDDMGGPLFDLRPSLPCKGIVVDEASMVGRDVYRDLISFGLPVIFVGDHGQLEPVGEDIYLMSNPDFRLETVHRNAGDIARFAFHLRSGGSPYDFDKSEKVTVVAKKDCSPHLLEANQIICAFNNSRVAINKHIRSIKGYDVEMPVIGDRVISLQNSRKLRIFNGTQGILTSVLPTKLTLKLPDKKIVKAPYNVRTFNQEKTLREGFAHPFDYAYAITCHKAQGSEWDKVMVLEQISSMWDHKRWAYTAASRAKKQVIWITQ